MLERRQCRAGVLGLGKILTTNSERNVLPQWVSFCSFFVLLICCCGCNPESADRSLGTGELQANQASENDEPLRPQLPPAITVGSFNIKQFSQKKMNKPVAAEVIVQIARRFDILAIQELREKGDTAVQQLITAINSDGSQYAILASEEQFYESKAGVRSPYFERSIFVYDTQKIKSLTQPFIQKDRTFTMYRSPFVGHFQCQATTSNDPFSFMLLNFHCRPRDTEFELAVMEQIVNDSRAWLKQQDIYEDDLILLGDFNRSPETLQNYPWFTHQYLALSNERTNLARTKSYDNFVFDSQLTGEYVGVAGVIDFQADYLLTDDQARDVSDHFPIYAVFSSVETPVTVTRAGKGELQ